MVDLPIVGNLPIGAKGFPIVAKGFPGGADGFPSSWIAPVFALASIGFLPIITLQCNPSVDPSFYAKLTTVR